MKQGEKNDGTVDWEKNVPKLRPIQMRICFCESNFSKQTVRRLMDDNQVTRVDNGE